MTNMYEENRPAFTLEEQQAEAEVAIKRLEQAMRLYKNRDFKDLVLNHYMVEEAAAYARQSADPGYSERQRQDSMAMAQAAGHFKRFLQKIVQQGMRAQDERESLREAIESEA